MADNINVSVVEDGAITVSIVEDGAINITLSDLVKEVWKSQSFPATSGQTLFTLTFTPRLTSQIIFKNGVFQAPTADYTISGSAITFNSGLDTGDYIDVIYVQN